MSDAVPIPGANMGEPVPRYEARAKVTGRLRYAADTAVPRPLYAYLVLSAIAKGRIADIDEASATAVPGVQLLMTYRNRPPIKPVKTFSQGGPALTSEVPLSGPEISYAGQIVAMVVADSYEAAREAGHRLVIRYDAQSPSATFDAAGIKVEKTTEAIEGKEDVHLGDAAGALRASPVRIEAAYSTPVQHHNPIELFSTIATWDGDRLTIDEPSQFVYGLRACLATQLDMPQDHVHVLSRFLGGAFGSKGGATPRTALVAVAARQLGRPVKLVVTRTQGFTVAGNRQETRHRVALGAGTDGRLTAYTHDLDELCGRIDPYGNGGVDASSCMYAFPAIASDSRLMRADRNPPTFMRSPPEVPVMFALESAMDELAVKLGMDPVQLRRINDTKVNPSTGKPFTSRSLVECYDAAAAAFGWQQRTPQPGSMRDGDWLIGWGCATATYPTQMAPAVVRIRLASDGRTLVQIAAHDVGTGAYTILQQEAALRLGVPLAKVTVQLGDTTLPPGPVAGGSITSASVISAANIACQQLLAQLGLNAVPDDHARERAFARIGKGEIETIGEYIPVSAKLKTSEALYKGAADISGGPKGDKTRFAFGAEFVEVRINRFTREIRVPRMVGAFAAGRILNPRTAHSQLMGGMIWGMASALLEATEIDTKRARYANDNIAEYLVAVNADVPKVDVILVPEVDSETNPSGAKGLGELGNVGTAAAVANAVYHATGQRFRDLPITIDKLIRV